MPAPDTGGTKAPTEARAIVESLGLDAGALGDGELSALALQHPSDQFTTSELETLVNIQAELDCLSSTVGVEGSLEEDLDGGGDGLTTGEVVETVVTISSTNHGEGDVPQSPESILPDVLAEATQDMDIHDIEISTPSPDQELTLQLPSPSHHLTNSLSLASSAVTSKTSQSGGSSIVVIQSPMATSTCSVTPTHVTVSGGQIVGKIAGLSSNVAISSVPQFQSITQTLVTAKSADGNIVQLRPTNIGRPLMTTSTSNLLPGNLQGIKPLQASIKRPATGGSGHMRNVFAKVIITANQQGQQGQPIMLATSQSGETYTSGQPIKIIGSSSGQNTLLASPTKAITLAQAQQMGLLSPTKLQQILPSSPNKQSIIVNKLVTSPMKSSPTKITMMPASTLVKSPTKILPAPVSGVTQLKPTSVSLTTMSGISSVTTANTTVKPMSPQKVIIRPGQLKAGTMLTSTTGAGQVIRIPATQNMLGTTTSLAQIQVQGGKQLQYVRLVSSASSNTTTVATSVRPKTTTMVPVSSMGGTVKPVALTSVHRSQQMVKMVPIAPATPTGRTVMANMLRQIMQEHINDSQERPEQSNLAKVVPKSSNMQPGQRILIPASAPVPQLRAGSNVTTLSASTMNQLASGTLLPSGASSFVMLPAQYVQQVRNIQSQPVAARSVLSSQSQLPTNTGNNLPPAEPRPAAPARTTIEPNGIRPRKPCNCTKSQCLKLYCDCFANGEFCHMCNCNNCFNNLDHEEDRQRAIKSCLDRNPNAFRPKIGKGMVGDERRHNKGCNCKRSGCLKNYCECYEAKIPCSNNCKCVGCRNVEESVDKKSLRDLAEAAEVRVQQQTAIKNKLSAQIQDIAFRPQIPTQPGSRQPFNFMTQEVLDATCQCLLAQAEEAERTEQSEEEAERLIIEEFGRCLVQIIECSSKTEANTIPM